MTIEMLIAGLESERDSAKTRAKNARDEIESILAEARRLGRELLTSEEDARCERLFEVRELATAEADKAERKLVEARKVKTDEDRINAQARDIRPAGACAGGSYTRRSEER